MQTGGTQTGDSEASAIALREGYFPGLIGQVAERHAVYYHEAWGFDASFEIQVAGELAAFVARFDSARDGLWSAVEAGSRLAGAIAICGPREEEPALARLRWFIVAPHHQGTGIGRRLLGRAMGFCRLRGFEQVALYTFRGLDTARRLYEAAGFHLSEEHAVHQWGQSILEQRFDLKLGRGTAGRAT